MSQPHEDAPLATGSLAGSEETLLVTARPRGGSNSRALKIAGLTTLACLLLASQVFTAYMVFDQKQQIHTLQKNSERMGKQLTRSSQVSPVRMAMPMSSLPLMTDFTGEDTKETPLTKLEDTVVVSVEQQLMNLMKNVSLPQFNQTFQDNLQSLRQETTESEWKNFESWMRFWLIFQMAQQKPAAPTPQSAFLIKTPCQLVASSEARKVGTYKPQCDEQGRYMPMQCWHGTGFCWCVDESGKVIEGTSIRGRPDCRRDARFARIMAAPRMMQETYNSDDN